MSYDVNAKLDAYRESIKKKEEILAQLNQGVVNTQAEIHMLTGAIQELEDIANSVEEEPKKSNDKKADRKYFSSVCSKQL